jgi:hypothetical protein
MSDMFAGVALHPMEKWEMLSVWTGNLTLRRFRGASPSTIVAAVVTPEVVSMVIGVAIANVGNSIPNTAVKVPTASFEPKSPWG